MKVFKFGGGILGSAETVKKIPSVLGMFPGEPLIIVVSAFGKTTNALEKLIDASFRQDKDYQDILKKIIDYHMEILQGLFTDSNHDAFKETRTLWIELTGIIVQEPLKSYSEFYDQAICFGELVSSLIVSHSLNSSGFKNKYFDVRRILKTDSTFREALVDWNASHENADREIRPVLEQRNGDRPIMVTQGFIGSDQYGRSTSLGREGSDYTASVFASLLDANEVIIWKDVPGILNADPKHFHQTIKLDQISYSEATELAYYGAKVIHPKTVKPLQNKGIPLQIRSFVEPGSPGTLIHAEAEYDSSIPNFIFKFNQILISVSTRDLSFIDERVFKDVFALLSRFSIHMNIIQNSALTLSFCIDDHRHVKDLIGELQGKYAVRYNEGLELITIRHFNDHAAEQVLQYKQVLLEQHNRTVVQYVVR